MVVVRAGRARPRRRERRAAVGPAAPQARPTRRPRRSIASSPTLLRRLEQALVAGDPRADPRARLGSRRRTAIAAGLRPAPSSVPAPTRAVVRERDRAPIDGRRRRHAASACSRSLRPVRAAAAASRTWRLDADARRRRDARRGAIADAGVASPPSTASTASRSIATQAVPHHAISRVARRGSHAHHSRSGVAFAAVRPSGATGVRRCSDEGEMQFTPKPAAEQGQLRIFAGEDVLRDAVQRRLPAPSTRRSRATHCQRRADRGARSTPRDAAPRARRSSTKRSASRSASS